MSFSVELNLANVFLILIQSVDMIIKTTKKHALSSKSKQPKHTSTLQSNIYIKSSEGLVPPTYFSHLGLPASCATTYQIMPLKQKM